MTIPRKSGDSPAMTIDFLQVSFSTAVLKLCSTLCIRTRPPEQHDLSTSSLPLSGEGQGGVMSASRTDETTDSGAHHQDVRVIAQSVACPGTVGYILWTFP